MSEGIIGSKEERAIMLRIQQLEDKLDKYVKELNDWHKEIAEEHARLLKKMEK